MKIRKDLFIFIRPAAYPNPRVRKMMGIGEELGFKTEFWGAFRERGVGKTENWHGITIGRLGIRYPYTSFMYFPGTLIFLITAALKLFRDRPVLVHASDLEGLFAAVLYRLVFRKSRLLFNIHDNFFVRYKVPGALRRLLKFIECRSARVADMVLLPDEMRLKVMEPYVPKKVIIVPNTLPDPGYDTPPEMPPLRVLAAGWLTWTRGYRVLGDIVKKRSDIELVVAGNGSQNVIDYIRSLPRTKYYGFLDQEEVLKIGKTCHIVTAFYDPSIEVNVLAAPNKVFDAMALGRPVVVNGETVISDRIKNWQCGYTVKYNDAHELENLFDHILKNPDDAMEKGENGRRIFKEEFDWVKIKREIMDAVKEVL